jgi:hypothetical protein
MVTHVVCLDGTDQTKAQQNPTNMARLFDALGGVVVDAGNGSLETTAAGPPATSGKYLPGVGSQGNPILRILGDAFGDGIAEPIVRGYTFLSRGWRPGDAIVITGFSRGSAAARALAGFVCGQGLLDASKYDVTDKDAAYLRAIAAWYAYRKERPDLADQTRVDFISANAGQQVPTLGAGDFTAPPPILAVGVFDTVSSLGLPQLNSNGDAVFDFSICDTTLSDNVQHGFHALSADETRDLFAPTFWAAREGVIEHIFPGSHSNVGGGFPERGLSDAALEWMLSRLESVGLAFDRTRISPAMVANPLDIARDDGATFPFNGTPRRARAFPASALVSDVLLARWGQPTEVLPAIATTPYEAAGTYADGTPLNQPQKPTP